MYALFYSLSFEPLVQKHIDELATELQLNENELNHFKKKHKEKPELMVFNILQRWFLVKPRTGADPKNMLKKALLTIKGLEPVVLQFFCSYDSCDNASDDDMDCD